MKLSKLTDYSLVLLSRLAVEKELQTARGLSQKTAIPEPTVAKLMKALVKQDIVSSVRGSNGGYRLAIDASNISAARVIEAIEGPIELTQCVTANTGSCILEGSCHLSGRWEKINGAVKSALEEISLKDLA